MSDCIFCKIVAGEIPAKVVYRDEQVTAFHDINPIAPVHVLIVPNEHMASTAAAEPRHEAMLGHMFTVARAIAAQQGVAERGFRLVVNNGPEAGQEVPHLHMHLIGGRRMGRIG